MKVLYVFRSLANWGGIERVLVDKMNGLVRLYGIDVYMITTDQGIHPIPYDIDNKVKIEDLNINFHHRYRYGFLRRQWVFYRMKHKYMKLLRERILSICPEVIICVSTDIISPIIKVKGTIPLIIESHSICNRTIIFGCCRLLRMINRTSYLRLISKADVIVALTERDAKEWRKYHSRVEAIPNILHFSDTNKSPLTSKHVLFVGRFDYQKCAQDAINIWDTVVEKYPDWVLDIYGEGEMEDEIIKLASSVHNVILHKPTKNIFDVYVNSSVLISTSLFEPFGLVMIEAMSCGLPVVAYDCQYGPVEIINDGVDGFLIKDRDKDSFVEKVCCLMSSFTLRKEMGISGIESSKRYNQDEILQRWISLFEAVSSQKYYKN